MKTLLFILFTAVTAQASFGETCKTEGTMPFHIAELGMTGSHAYSHDHARMGITTDSFYTHIYSPEGELLPDKELRSLAVDTWICVLASDGYVTGHQNVDDTRPVNTKLEKALMATIERLSNEKAALVSKLQEVTAKQDSVALENKALGILLTESLGKDSSSKSTLTLFERSVNVDPLILPFLLVLSIIGNIFLFVKNRRMAIWFRQLEHLVEKWIEKLGLPGSQISEKRSIVSKFELLYVDRMSINHAARRYGIDRFSIWQTGIASKFNPDWFYIRQTENRIELPGREYINKTDFINRLHSHPNTREELALIKTGGYGTPSGTKLQKVETG